MLEQRILTGRQRLISALEFLVGAAIVIGHNVFHVVPNEVLILFVLGLVSFRLRNGAFSAIGFRRPESWKFIVGLALAAAAFRTVVGEFAILPIAENFLPPVQDSPATDDDITGDVASAALWLLIVWTFAAFGEEIGYRGYLLGRAADVGHRTTAAYWVAIVLVAILFGYGHYYKGPAGVIDSAFSGLVMGAVYMIARKNLWACVLTHGFRDTFAVLVAFLGWES